MFYETSATLAPALLYRISSRAHGEMMSCEMTEATMLVNKGNFMKTNMKNESGFTLIELILVIAIIGMLTAAIAPSFTTLLADSGEASAKGTAGAIQSSINTAIAQNIVAGYPGTGNTSSPVNISAAIDSASSGVCSSTNFCFSSVSSTPVSGNWRKTSATTYRFYVNPNDTTTNYLTYTYAPNTNGNSATFLCTSSAGTYVSC